MTHIKWDVVNLTQMLKSKIIITMMENNYFFIKNTYQNTEQGGCSCNLEIIARNEEFQFTS